MNCTGVPPKDCNQSLQEDLVVDKLYAYFAWAKEDPMIYGMNFWHFSHGAGGRGFEFGAIDMPKAAAVLTEIGAFIRSGSPAAKTDDVDEQRRRPMKSPICFKTAAALGISMAPNSKPRPLRRLHRLHRPNIFGKIMNGYNGRARVPAAWGQVGGAGELREMTEA
jgi:hypothetical protein